MQQDVQSAAQELLGCEITPLPADESFRFSCRACGHLCCVNQTILLTPPEAARIHWHIQRNPQVSEFLKTNGNETWGNLFVGGNSGLPVLTLSFAPATANGAAEFCPFLALVAPPPEGALDVLGAAMCAIHAVRPGACRIYPLGRVSVQADENETPDWTYWIASRCPGFESSLPGEFLPHEYRPPDQAKATVVEWASRALDAEVEVEKDFYVRTVIPAYLRARLHAPTENNPDGLLPEDAVIGLGSHLFYRIPDALENPAEDHGVIMAWLDAMLTTADQLKDEMGCLSMN